jgi:hypothetical protein
VPQHHSAASLGSHLLEAIRSGRGCNYNGALQAGHQNYAPNAAEFVGVLGDVVPQGHQNYAPNAAEFVGVPVQRTLVL